MARLRLTEQLPPVGGGAAAAPPASGIAATTPRPATANTAGRERGHRGWTGDRYPRRIRDPETHQQHVPGGESGEGAPEPQEGDRIDRAGRRGQGEHHNADADLAPFRVDSHAAILPMVRSTRQLTHPSTPTLAPAPSAATAFLLDERAQVPPARAAPPRPWRLLQSPRSTRLLFARRGSHRRAGMDAPRDCYRTEAVTSFGPPKGCAMLIAVRRSNARSACSLRFKPILSKRADCRSPAGGGVHAGGGVAVEKDEQRQRLSSRRRGDRFARRSGSSRSRSVTCVRGTACLCTPASVLGRDRRLSKRLRPPSGFSWAATTASTDGLVSTGTDRATPATRAIAFLFALPGVARALRRRSARPLRVRGTSFESSPGCPALRPSPRWA